jgi:hypothetical protein
LRTRITAHYCQEELIAALEKFVTYYNHQRYHESLENVTPADVYYGRQDEIKKYREAVKKNTLKRRRQNYLRMKIAT